MEKSLLCKGCGKKHKDRNWKYINGGWYCTKYHKPSKMGEFMPKSVKDEKRVF